MAKSAQLKRVTVVTFSYSVELDQVGLTEQEAIRLGAIVAANEGFATSHCDADAYEEEVDIIADGTLDFEGAEALRAMMSLYQVTSDLMARQEIAAEMRKELQRLDKKLPRSVVEGEGLLESAFEGFLE